MSTQLDILALEPYFGGFRREMLETLTRNSRHRWKILKLPPRRLERRLTTAARWFAEQMSRHTVGHFDVLFTTETLNLADLYRLAPALSRKPSIVYFHSHQLGDSSLPDQPHDYVNLSSASAASELWFISKFGRRDFFSTAQEVVDRDAELTAQDVLTNLTSKSLIVTPPVDTSMDRDKNFEIDTDASSSDSVLLNSHGVDLPLLTGAFEILRARGIIFRVKVIGPTAGLPAWLTVESTIASDPSAVARAVLQCKLYLSVSPECAFDENAVRALNVGRPALLPKAGGYVELVPGNARDQLLYDVSPRSLADALAKQLTLSSAPTGYKIMHDRQNQFEPIAATRQIDDRIRKLATVIS